MYQKCAVSLTIFQIVSDNYTLYLVLDGFSKVSVSLAGKCYGNGNAYVIVYVCYGNGKAYAIMYVFYGVPAAVGAVIDGKFF